MEDKDLYILRCNYLGYLLMMSDDLAMQRAEASAAMAITYVLSSVSASL